MAKKLPFTSRVKGFSRTYRKRPGPKHHRKAKGKGKKRR
jgi:hypothetical protein